VGWRLNGRAERVQCQIDFLIAGPPVRDGQANGTRASPRGSPEPDVPAALHRAEDLVGPLVGLEPEEDLVEHDVVDELGTGYVDDSRGKSARAGARSLDEVRQTDPAEGTQRGIDDKAACTT
jgi:hypothetical protein